MAALHSSRRTNVLSSRSAAAAMRLALRVLLDAPKVQLLCELLRIAVRINQNPQLQTVNMTHRNNVSVLQQA
jgi:hypothetical protein